MPVEWTPGKRIGEMLDVSTGACSYCKGPARVPEDVAAVMEHQGEQWPLIVCPSCYPSFMERLEQEMDQAKREEEGI